MSQVLVLCPYPFPSFQNNHADSSSEPFIGSFQKLPHIGQFVVVHPANDGILELPFPLFQFDDFSAVRQSFQVTPEFSLGFYMYPKTKPRFSLVEPVPKKLNLTGVCHYGFLHIDFEK